MSAQRVAIFIGRFAPIVLGLCGLYLAITPGTGSLPPASAGTLKPVAGVSGAGLLLIGLAAELMRYRSAT